ncbi:hypothetical protein ACFPYN_13965 [Paenisporosarcina macmurdoensis]|uniref:Uncharacterized protein n=1 Tax=Paenisporosarcina macmurdoensis TaxID=212659 RepID=A0ABW1LA04_9BACL
MNTQKNALYTAMDFWSNGSFRDDHFDGENGLYRLSARIPLDPKSTVPRVLEYSHYLIGKLYELSVKPTRMFIHDNMFEVEWRAIGYQVVSSKAQYMELILHFAHFLERNQFDNIDLQLGFLSDCPVGSIHEIPMNDINFSPQFNIECFGSKGTIEVICIKKDFK